MPHFKIHSFGTPSSFTPNMIKNAQNIDGFQNSLFSINQTGDDPNSVIQIPVNVLVPIVLDNVTNPPREKNFSYLLNPWGGIPTPQPNSHVIQYNGTIPQDFLVMTNSSIKYDENEWTEEDQPPTDPIELKIELRVAKNATLPVDVGDFTDVLLEKTLNIEDYYHSYTANGIVTLEPGDILWYFAQSTVEEIPVNGLVLGDFSSILTPV